jgi:Protein of unknown function (DUF2946)
MNFYKNRLIHWIAAFAVAMSALAPTVSQAVSIAQGGHGLAMDICAVDGSKIQITIDLDQQTEQANQTQPCPYCLVHTAITPAFITNLKFGAPQSFAFLPQLFYQSPKPLTAWVIPPSAAPPAQA